MEGPGFVTHYTAHMYSIQAKYGWGEEGNKRYAPRCPRGSGSKIPFEILIHQTTQPIILIQDGAKYHTSTETKAFFAQQTARLQVVQLPTYSPDYNPIEKLWKKIKQQETHLHYFPTFEALTEKVEQALLKFTNAPEEILALCSLPTKLAQAA